MAAPNPFEVLRLDPKAPEVEIVRQAGRLRQRATDEAALAAVRQAVQALTGRAEERTLYALLTHPVPRYEWPALEKFAAAFRRAPAAASMPAARLPFDLDEFAALLQAVVAEELNAPPLPFEPVNLSEDATEIHLQTAEVIWQSLVFDARA
jgi:hypothetical protein